MDSHILLKRLMATGLGVMLLAAACTPATTDATPIGTESGVNTQVVSSPAATAQATEGTAVGTEMATSEATAMSTEMATPEATAMSTAVGTEPATTGTPNAEVESSVLLSSELIGSEIVDQNGDEIGEVHDLLVNSQGLVQYVVFDAEDYLDEQSTDATPVATSEANGEDDGVRAVAFTEFTVNQASDDDEQVLVYNGTADSLNSMGSFNDELFSDDAFVIDASQSNVAADITYDGLIRLSQVDDFDLQNADGDELGEINDVIVDASQGMVTYGVVDFGGFLGLGEQTVAVPWNLLTVHKTDENANLMLEATKDTLENAPTIDLGDWPKWSERVDTNTDWSIDWESQINTFWNGAASQ